MRNFKTLTLFTLLSLILVFVIAFCISGTVVSQSNHSRETIERYYDDLESEYLAKLKSLLAEEGYRNSGVTMTRVIDENGIRSYTVNIHHGSIGRLSFEEKDLLAKACKTVSFADEECDFFHNFL